jgi:hypothetical protein
VLFASPSLPSAARGGRVGLDAACEAERVKRGLAQTKTHAFISVDGKDYLAAWGTAELFADLPQTRRVVGPTGVEIASSWNQMLLAGAEQSLICAEVVPSDSYWWLSGATQVGLLVGTQLVYGQPGSLDETCKGWTFGTADPVTRARPGSTELSGPAMFAAAGPITDKIFFVNCDHTASFPTLCLAYTP